MTKPCEETDRTIRLVFHEGEAFDTDILAGKISIYIKEYPEILLPSVRSPILSKILAWDQHHREEPEPGLQQDLSVWDAEFLDIDGTTLLEPGTSEDGLLSAVAKGIMMEP